MEMPTETQSAAVRAVASAQQRPAESVDHTCHGIQGIDDLPFLRNDCRRIGNRA